MNGWKNCGFWIISSKDKSVDWDFDGGYPEGFCLEGNLVWNSKGRKPKFAFWLFWINKLLLQGTYCYDWNFQNSRDKKSVDWNRDGRNAESSSGKKGSVLGNWRSTISKSWLRVWYDRCSRLLCKNCTGSSNQFIAVCYFWHRLNSTVAIWGSKCYK